MEDPMTSIKVDIAFSNALNSVRNFYSIHVCLHCVQFIAMIIMIPLDILILRKQSTNDEVLTFFITAACVTFSNMIIKLAHHRCLLNDLFNIVVIATDLNHIIVEEEPQSERLNEKQSQGLQISNQIYNIQNNMTLGQATPQIKQSLEPALQNMIKSIALSRDPITRCAMTIGSGISFALFVYGIVVMSMYPMQVGEIVVMILFLLSEFFIQFTVFACIILIALLPLICLCYCAVICCCRQGARPAKLPPTVPANLELIQKSEGSCAICFQNIILDQQVIVLPCSQKHVFHDKCLSTWTAIKPNCPVCRHDLTQ